MLKDNVDFDEAIVATPGTTKCIAHVQTAAKLNWKLFASKTVRELNGHLLMYPYVVGSDGVVSARRECFPDTCANAKVLGTYDPTVPELLTY
jgi:phospholipase D1/2